MEGSALARFTRALSAAKSRRHLLHVAAGLPLVGVLTHLDGGEGAAKRKRHGRRRSHRPGKHKDNRKGKRKGKGGGGGGLGATNCDVCPSGCTFTSVQAAIEAASAGETITICPGTYTEDLTISKNLTLAGSGEGAAVAGAGDSSVVTVQEGVTATIQAVAIGKGIGTPIGNVRFGGGIFNEGDLTLIDLDMGENTAGGGGAIFNMGTLTLNQVIIDDNQADQGGGIMSQSQVTIGNATEISNNQANQGGGIYNNGGTLLISGGSFVVGNAADSDGGGLYNDGGESTIDASFVQDNTAKANGGGVLNRGTLTAQNDTVISKNTAKNGGGVYNLGDPEQVQPVLTVVDSAVSENTASEVGGGIFNDEGNVTLQAGTVFNNQATATGGGIFNTDGGEVTLDAESAVVENTPNNCIGTPACTA